MEYSVLYGCANKCFSSTGQGEGSAEYIRRKHCFMCTHRICHGTELSMSRWLLTWSPRVSLCRHGNQVNVDIA